MKPKNSRKLVALHAETARFRERYRKQVRRWIETLSEAIDSVAKQFSPEDLIMVLVVYELMPWQEIRGALITDFQVHSLDRDAIMNDSYSHPGLQHVIAQRIEYFADFADDWGGVEGDLIYNTLARSDSTLGDGVATRIRAMPHGVRAYPKRWSSQALLGMLALAHRKCPWRTDDASGSDVINFEGGDGADDFDASDDDVTDDGAKEVAP